MIETELFFPFPVLPPEKTAEYRACFAEMEQVAGQPLARIGHPAMHFAWAYRLATEPAVLDAVEEVLGPDLLLAGSLVLCKYPRDPAFVSWHQDNYYSNLHLTPSLSAWIALAGQHGREWVHAGGAWLAPRRGFAS